MSTEFAGTIAVVTGASSGIGRATAELLVERGARVAVLARRSGKLEEIVAAHQDVVAVTGDVSDETDVDRLFAETEKRLGPCTLLVNNAGMVHPKLLVDTTPAEWDRMFAVNVRGAYLCARRALPAMIAAQRGSIINVSSISGIAGPEKFPGFVSYCASKAALIEMTEALAAEVKVHGIRVNCVSPGSVDTAMLQAASAGAVPDMSPAEVAEAILFLASERARPIAGQNLHVFSA